jgi:hypothetical protein
LWRAVAWLDERIWCHPKMTDLTDRAFRVYVNGLAYSSGFGCRGHLTAGQQKAIGATGRVRGELVRAGLWEDAPGGSIDIHDWDGHNAKREARRAANRDAAHRYRNRNVIGSSSQLDDANGDERVTS